MLEKWLPEWLPTLPEPKEEDAALKALPKGFKIVEEPKEETKPKENFFSQFDKEEEKNKKRIKDKISKCMFKNVKKVTNALQYRIVQKECKRRAEASTK